MNRLSDAGGTLKGQVVEIHDVMVLVVLAHFYEKKEDIWSYYQRTK